MAKASWFENMFGGVVLFGGLLALVVGIPTWIYKAVWGEDKISPPVIVSVPTGPEMVISFQRSVFKVPARDVGRNLIMHTIDLNDDVRTYGTIQQMKKIGLRPADLAECEAYLVTIEEKGIKAPHQLLCLGSLYFRTDREFRFESVVHYSAIYPDRSGDKRYVAKGILKKTVHCANNCLAVKIDEVK